MQLHQEGCGHRKDYRIDIVDNLSTGRLENPESLIDSVKQAPAGRPATISGWDCQEHCGGAMT